MPFQSEKQRRYLWANEPEIARDWADTYGSRIKKDDGGIMDVPRRRYFSGAYGQGAGDRGGDPHASTAQNIAAGHVTGNEAQQLKEQYNITKKDIRTAKKENKQRKKELKKEARKKKFKKYTDKTKKFLKDQLQAKLDTGYDFSMGLWGQRKRSHGYATDFLTKLEDEGKDISAFEDILNKDSKDWSAEDFNRVKALGGYEDYLAEYKGAPGMKESGNVGGLNKYVKTFKKDKYGKPTKTPLTYGYTRETGGEGPIYYPGYVPGGTPQGGGGGGGATAATTPDTPSAFQESLTAGVNNPFAYYVGEDPTEENLAWGEQFGVDPRTMYRTSWAADGGRIGRAYGGIMDTATGRRAYGLGSIFKSVKKAAKKVLGSKAGKIGLTALALGMPWSGGAPALTGKWFGGASGWGKMAPYLFKGGEHAFKSGALEGWNPWKLGIGAASILPFFMGGDDDDDDERFDYEGAKNKYMDELMRIKAGAMAGTLDPNKFRYLGIKDGGRIGLSNGGDPLLREEYDKYVFEMKEMGLQPMSFEEFLAQARAGMYAGGQSTPSDYTMEDAMMTTTQDKLGGITDVMKQADLNRQGSVGQFYAADGGRIGYQGGGETGYPPIITGQVPQTPPQMPTQPPQRPHPMPAPQPNRMAGMPGGMNPMMNRPMMNPMGGRRMAQEGGLMDLGGMEKDYRNDGGFVPLGGEEKADDVPARLSKNEFVFTADAVRGAGDGDIDKGAEIMENIMKNLEQGGQISEETQGLSGAREMFGVSERLGEVL